MNERRQNDTAMLELLVNLQKTASATEQAVKDLAGPQGRVTMLEAAQTRNWWITVAVAPVLISIHGLLRKLGVNI